MQSRLRTILFGTALTVLVPVGALMAQAKDPILGTWQLDVAKSKYDPGPGPKMLTLTYEAVGDGIKVTTKGVDGQGKPIATEYTANYDGKDYPVSGETDYEAVSLKRVSPLSVTITRKKSGKVVETVTRVVSADGKTLTVTVTGTNAKGQTVHDVAVYGR